MADVAEVKEALERGVQVIDWSAYPVIEDAARRWVRMVEGLDYEAAATAWTESQYPLPPWMQDLPVAHHSEVIQTVQIIVDTALGREKEDSDE